MTTTASWTEKLSARELDLGMENWQIFTDPRFQLHLRYPAVTPQGNMVELQDEQTRDFARVHLISRDSQEVYFEVRRYRDLLPQEEYQRHRVYLEKRFALEGFTITKLTPLRLGEAAAHEYSFQWNGMEWKAACGYPHPARFSHLSDHL